MDPWGWVPAKGESRGWGRWTGSLLSRAGPGFVESIRPDERGNLWKASRGLASFEVGQAHLGNGVERPGGAARVPRVRADGCLVQVGPNAQPWRTATTPSGIRVELARRVDSNRQQVGNWHGWLNSLQTRQAARCSPSRDQDPGCPWQASSPAVLRCGARSELGLRIWQPLVGGDVGRGNKGAVVA
jgi:hypothetical protein